MYLVDTFAQRQQIIGFRSKLANCTCPLAFHINGEEGIHVHLVHLIYPLQILEGAIATDIVIALELDAVRTRGTAPGVP